MMKASTRLLLLVLVPELTAPVDASGNSDRPSRGDGDNPRARRYNKPKKEKRLSAAGAGGGGGPRTSQRHHDDERRMQGHGPPQPPAPVLGQQEDEGRNPHRGWGIDPTMAQRRVLGKIGERQQDPHRNWGMKTSREQEEHVAGQMTRDSFLSTGGDSFLSWGINMGLHQNLITGGMVRRDGNGAEVLEGAKHQAEAVQRHVAVPEQEQGAARAQGHGQSRDHTQMLAQDSAAPSVSVEELQALRLLLEKKCGESGYRRTDTETVTTTTAGSGSSADPYQNDNPARRLGLLSTTRAGAVPPVPACLQRDHGTPGDDSKPQLRVDELVSGCACDKDLTHLQEQIDASLGDFRQSLWRNARAAPKRTAQQIRELSQWHLMMMNHYDGRKNDTRRHSDPGPPQAQRWSEMTSGDEEEREDDEAARKDSRGTTTGSFGGTGSFTISTGATSSSAGESKISTRSSSAPSAPQDEHAAGEAGSSNSRPSRNHRPGDQRKKKGKAIVSRGPEPNTMVAKNTGIDDPRDLLQAAGWHASAATLHPGALNPTQRNPTEQAQGSVAGGPRSPHEHGGHEVYRGLFDAVTRRDKMFGIGRPSDDGREKHDAKEVIIFHSAQEEEQGRGHGEAGRLSRDDEQNFPQHVQEYVKVMRQLYGDNEVAMPPEDKRTMRVLAQLNSKRYVHPREIDLVNHHLRTVQQPRKRGSTAGLEEMLLPPAAVSLSEGSPSDAAVAAQEDDPRLSEGFSASPASSLGKHRGPPWPTPKRFVGTAAPSAGGTEVAPTTLGHQHLQQPLHQPQPTPYWTMSPVMLNTAVPSSWPNPHPLPELIGSPQIPPQQQPPASSPIPTVPSSPVMSASSRSGTPGPGPATSSYQQLSSPLMRARGILLPAASSKMKHVGSHNSMYSSWSMPTTAEGSQSQYNEGLSSRLGSAQSLLELGGRFSDNFSEDGREVGFEMDGLPASMESPESTTLDEQPFHRGDLPPAFNASAASFNAPSPRTRPFHLPRQLNASLQSLPSFPPVQEHHDLAGRSFCTSEGSGPRPTAGRSFGEESVYSAPDSLASSDSNRSDWRRQPTPDDCFVAAPGRYQAPHQATASAGGQQHQGQSPAHQLVHHQQVPVLPLQPTGCVVYAPVGVLMAPMAPASPCYHVMTPVMTPAPASPSVLDSDTAPAGWEQHENIEPAFGFALPPSAAPNHQVADIRTLGPLGERDITAEDETEEARNAQIAAGALLANRDGRTADGGGPALTRSAEPVATRFGLSWLWSRPNAPGQLSE